MHQNVRIPQHHVENTKSKKKLPHQIKIRFFFAFTLFAILVHINSIVIRAVELTHGSIQTVERYCFFVESYHSRTNAIPKQSRIMVGTASNVSNKVDTVKQCRIKSQTGSNNESSRVDRVEHFLIISRTRSKHESNRVES